MSRDAVPQAGRPRPGKQSRASRAGGVSKQEGYQTRRSEGRIEGGMLKGKSRDEVLSVEGSEKG